MTNNFSLPKLKHVRTQNLSDSGDFDFPVDDISLFIGSQNSIKAALAEHLVVGAISSRAVLGNMLKFSDKTKTAVIEAEYVRQDGTKMSFASVYKFFADANKWESVRYAYTLEDKTLEAIRSVGKIKDTFQIMVGDGKFLKTNRTEKSHVVWANLWFAARSICAKYQNVPDWFAETWAVRGIKSSIKFDQKNILGNGYLEAKDDLKCFYKMRNGRYSEIISSLNSKLKISEYLERVRVNKNSITGEYDIDFKLKTPGGQTSEWMNSKMMNDTAKACFSAFTSLELMRKITDTITFSNIDRILSEHDACILADWLLSEKYDTYSHVIIETDSEKFVEFVKSSALKNEISVAIVR